MDIDTDTNENDDINYIESFFEMLKECLKLNRSPMIIFVLEHMKNTPDLREIVLTIIEKNNLVFPKENAEIIRHYIESYYSYVRKAYMEIEPAKTRVILFFDMLNDCIQKNPKDVNHIISRICGTQDLNTCKSRALLQDINESQIDENYTFVENVFKNLHKYRTIRIRDNVFTCYDLKSIRTADTIFDVQFIRDRPETMLLYIYTHGEIMVQTNHPVVKDFNGLLNKFAIAGPGFCGVSSARSAKYVLYNMCDVVQNGGDLDIPSIVREGYVESEISTDAVVDPAEIYAKTQETVVHDYLKSNSHIREATYTTNDTGGITTYGSQYFEKSYTIDVTDTTMGVFICKDWKEINALALDNLLGNIYFINFMIAKYGNEVVIRNMIQTGTVYIVGTFLASDILEFSAKYGRWYLSIVDNSCSVFKSTYKLTRRNIDMIRASVATMNPTIAKGIHKKIIRTRKQKKMPNKKKTNARKKMTKRK